MLGWIVAARLRFLPGSLLLFAFGVACGAGEVRAELFVLGGAIVVLVHLLTHFVNDAEDVATDALSTRPALLSGGSGAIQRGLITPRALLAASMVLVAITITLAAICAVLGAPLLAALALVILALGYSYSGRPLMLGRRGLGELAVGLAMGVCLPLAGACVTEGITPRALALTPVFFAQTLLARIATSFPDVDADRATAKWTLLALVGRERIAGVFVAAAVLNGIAGWAPGVGAVPGLRASAIVTALAGLGLAGWITSGRAERTPSSVPTIELVVYSVALVIVGLALLASPP